MIGIYARQSVDKKDSISIETQIEECKKELTKEEENNIKVYQDKGFSGKNIDRPSFKELLQDIKDGLITKVVCYKIDRISRNLLDFTKVNDILKKYDVIFISRNEKFDSSTAMGNAMLNICMVFAQLERETIQKRVTDNYYSRGERGYFLGGRTPQGYSKVTKNENGKKVIELVANDRAEVVKLIFDLYSKQDMTMQKVCNYLNEKGIKTVKGKNWDNSKIATILKNPVYVKANADIYTYYKNLGVNITSDISNFIGENGLYLYGKRGQDKKQRDKEKQHLTVASHKGIIESDIFLKCQYKIKSNIPIKNSNSGNRSWLSGLAKCGKCGYGMSISKNAKDKLYFFCRGRTELKVCEGHKNVLKVEEIEEIVETKMFQKIEELQNVKRKDNKSKKENDFKIKIAEIDNKIEKLIQQICTSTEIANKYINQEIEKLDKIKTNIITENQKELIEDSKKRDVKTILKEFDKWDNMDISKKKSLAKILINKVKIADESIEIEYNL